MRGAWIEIRNWRGSNDMWRSRSPCGERGLKSLGLHDGRQRSRRSPCGERGLKCRADGAERGLCLSLPVRGAWIEIRLSRASLFFFVSLPVRGAWIEIFRGGACASPSVVAPRAGSVD